MESNVFCVYEHWRPDTGTCFYVGKGKLKRAKLISRRENIRHVRIRDKLKEMGLNIEVRLFVQNVSEREAFDIEIERIAYYRAIGSDIVNMTDGGEGSSGHSLSEEHKNKISTSLRRLDRSLMPKRKSLSAEHKLNISKGGIGRVVSAETRIKLSIAQKGKIRPELIGRKVSDATKEKHRNKIFTDEYRNKISIGNKGKIRSDETKCKISESVKQAIKRRESVLNVETSRSA